MTNDKAIKILKECRERKLKYTFYTLDEYQAATDMAIQALEQTKQNVKIGRWIVKEKYHETYGVCSQCGMRNYAGYLNYCPDCGAKMGVEE